MYYGWIFIYGVHIQLKWRWSSIILKKLRSSSIFLKLKFRYMTIHIVYYCHTKKRPYPFFQQQNKSLSYFNLLILTNQSKYNQCWIASVTKKACLIFLQLAGFWRTCVTQNEPFWNDLSVKLIEPIDPSEMDACY